MQNGVLYLEKQCWKTIWVYSGQATKHMLVLYSRELAGLLIHKWVWGAINGSRKVILILIHSSGEPGTGVPRTALVSTFLKGC